MAEEKKLPSRQITVTNRGRAPRGFYDSAGNHVMVHPGQEIKAEVPESIATILQRGHDAGDTLRMGGVSENETWGRTDEPQQGLMPQDRGVAVDLTAPESKMADPRAPEQRPSDQKSSEQQKQAEQKAAEQKQAEQQSKK